MDIGAVLIFVCGLVVGMVMTTMYLRITSQEKAMADLQRKLEDLEQAGPKRLPYPAIEKTEDITAALIALQFEGQVQQNMIDNALEHARQMRNLGNGGKK